MDVSEQIKRFEKFIEQNYHVELLEAVSKGDSHIKVDFAKLSRFDPEIADIVLDQPEEVLKAFEIAIKNLDVPESIKRFHVRFFNVPKSQEILIRDIRSANIDKLICLNGIVRQKTDVRPQVTTAKFECPSCGNIMSVIQVESKFKEPSRCGCGRKGKFRMIDKELVDAQKIVLEEIPESLEGGDQPKRMDIFLKNDLVSPLSDKRTNPGTKIQVIGQVKEVPIPSKDGGKLVRFDLMVDSNQVIPLEESFGDIAISKEEEAQIMELAKDPKITDKLVNSMAPSIYGHDKVKEAIILQLLGGCRKQRSDGAVTRGDMHILLIGDPGAGKSQLLKRAQLIAPKSRYVSGKGASGAGLTASVVRDEGFLRGWALEAGALVLANKGFCMIDEMDKMTREDTAAMHEALEQQTVSISKANIQATLRCETTVLAAANPKWGRFDPYEILGKQIDLPPALISRFDLIFPIRDLPNKDQDERLAGFLLNLHQTMDAGTADIDTDMLKKYISYARRTCNPKLTDSALEELKVYYVKMRNSGGEEGGVKAIPITARQLEALVRLSEASAKTRLSEKVLRRDAKKAIELLHFCMSQVGVDPDTGKIDVDILTTGISSSARSNIIVIKEAINELENKIGKTIPVEDVIKEVQEKGVSADKAEEVIEKLKRSGDIFEPKRGFIQKI